MTVAMVLLPVFVQVALVYGLLFCLGARRGGALRAGEVSREAAGRAEAYPPRVRAVSDSLRNQSELPLLFFALVAFALLTRKADLLFVVMSWVFVLLRLVQALVHVTSNDLRWRSSAFAGGGGGAGAHVDALRAVGAPRTVTRGDG